MIDHTQPSFLSRNYPAFLLLVAILFGGTVMPGVWSDSLIYVAMIPAIFIGFSNFLKNNLEVATRVLVVLILSLIVFQFLPVHSSPILPVISGEHDQMFFRTSSVSGGLLAAMSGVVAIGFFLYLTTRDAIALQSLIKFIFIALAIHVVAAIIELSFSSRIEINGLLPYTIRLGLFSNENHFSSLTYLSIPLIAWKLLVCSWRPYIYAGIIFILLGLQFAVDARAGVGLGSLLAVFCVFWALTLKSSKVVKVISCLIAIIAVIVILFSDQTSSLYDFGIRSFYNSQTWKIALEHWLTGTGLGSFDVIWPFYETKEILEPKYIIQAHNDHLQLFMELGFWYFVLLTPFLILILKNAFNTELSQAASISILAVLIHSLVDFPMRTTAILCCFVFLVSIVLVSKHSPKKANRVKHKKIA